MSDHPPVERVSFATNPPSVTLMFPNREPYIFHDISSYTLFLQCLMVAAQEWERILLAERKAKL